MADKEINTDLEEIFKANLEEAKKKDKEEDHDDEGHDDEGHDEEEEEEEDEKSSKSKKKMTEETMAAKTLHPAAKAVSDPKSKIGMITSAMSIMGGMTKDDLNGFYKSLAQFAAGKDYGVGDNSAKNSATIDMKTGKGPKTKDAMPKISVKEDVEEMFNGYDLSEEFKENVSTIFEAAVSAKIIAETVRLEEEFETKISEDLATFNEQITTKLDTYLDYVVEQWMKENEVAIESTLRNELMEEFMDGLKDLFSEHYISVPETKVDVLEALAEKVSELEGKLDETISENVELKNFVVENHRVEILASISSDLALTQQEKFAALAEGIEFDGDLEVYEKKLKIIKENYFKIESTSYSSNIEEETFEGETSTTTVNVDPSVNRYVQAMARTLKK
jgi:hypothetical protein